MYFFFFSIHVTLSNIKYGFVPFILIIVTFIGVLLREKIKLNFNPNIFIKIILGVLLVALIFYELVLAVQIHVIFNSAWSQSKFYIIEFFLLAAVFQESGILYQITRTKDGANMGWRKRG